MFLRSNALTIAAAGFAVVVALFAASELSSRESDVGQPAKIVQDAPAIATFKIASADVLAPSISAGPLTGDCSN